MLTVAMEVKLPTPFLEWPAEIRNCIYEFYAASITSLGVNRGNSTASAPPLMQTNRQVRSEMSKLVSHELASSAVSFNAVAAGFNFDHILRFLERMKSDPATLVRDLNITVKFTRYCIDQQEVDNMYRWITAPTRFWGRRERHSKESDNAYAARSSEPPGSSTMIFEIYGQAYRIRFHQTTSEIKLRLASECGNLQRFAILYAIRMTRLPMRQPAPELAYCLYAFLQRQWPKYYSRPIFVNYAGFRAVSKDRRLCAKYGYTGVLRTDTFVRTTHPRPRSEALLR